jgi:hypothetical protein
MTRKHQRLIICLLITSALIITACGNNSVPPPVKVETQFVVVTATPAPSTNTPDPCASENIEAEVQKVHKHMREFDDASTLAASQQREQLAGPIGELQRIRREAEDQPAPACLAALKTYQISHMNAVINTLVSFMSGADQESVDQGIALARDQHDKYTLELARVLGLTVEPAAVVTPEQTPVP